MQRKEELKITSDQLEAAAEWWASEILITNKMGEKKSAQFPFWNELHILDARTNLKEEQWARAKFLISYKNKLDEGIFDSSRRFFQSKLYLVLLNERDRNANIESLELEANSNSVSILLQEAIKESKFSIELPAHAKMIINNNGCVLAKAGEDKMSIIYDAKAIEAEKNNEAREEYEAKQKNSEDFGKNYLRR